MNLQDIVATAKRLISQRKPFDEANRLIEYLVADLKPHLIHAQRIALAAGIYRQAQREIADVGC